jgi:UDP:flavonoid glycosyltransferase YjiC (YdhE family)
MWGAELVPQPAILPHVDLVVTHGGNNTVTEAFHHGKPMIVHPLFWDQHDNAQRMDETGFGIRADCEIRLGRVHADVLFFEIAAVNAAGVRPRNRGERMSRRPR